MVSLHNNPLITLPASTFTGSSNLREIDLRNNKLTTLESDLFDGLSNLQDLQLSGNQLNTLPSDIFDGLFTSATPLNHSWLLSIDLSDNQLTALHADLFDDKPRLEELDLSGNQVTSNGLPADVFNDLRGIHTLNLKDNRLARLPSNTMFSETYMPSLLRMGLSGNVGSAFIRRDLEGVNPIY